MQTPEWITAFDWEHADAQTRSGATVSARLVKALQERTLTTGNLANTAEATEFGRYVAALRRARNWSRGQLAEVAGIDPLAVPLLEQAALTPQELSPGLVGRMARAFNIPIEALPVNPAPQRTAITEPHHFGQWLRQVLSGAIAPATLSVMSTTTLASLSRTAAMGTAPTAPAPAQTVPEPAPNVPAPGAPLQAAAPKTPQGAPAMPPLPAPHQAAQPPLQKQTRMERVRARLLPTPSTPHKALADTVQAVGGRAPNRDAMRESGATLDLYQSPADTDPSPAPSLTQPLPLPNQELPLPHGQMARAFLALEPAESQYAGHVDLRVQLMDTADHALPGQNISVMLDGVSVAAPAPTDSAGVAYIPNLPLAVLLEIETFTLRLS